MSGTQARAFQNENQQKGNSQQPVDRIKVGTVEIPIWRNEGSGGDFFKAGSPQVSYKDANGNFQDGRNYGVMDLLALSKAADMAAERVMELQKSKSPGR